MKLVGFDSFPSGLRIFFDNMLIEIRDDIKNNKNYKNDNNDNNDDNDDNDDNDGNDDDDCSDNCE